MARPTVSVDTGALGAVLEKLTALLGVEQRILQKARCWGDIEFLRSKLEDMHSLLRRIWKREDLDPQCKKWMIDARELSYDMEDDIDYYFKLDLTRDGSGQRLKQLLRDHKMRVEIVSSRYRKEWEKFEAISPNSSKPSLDDPRARFLHKDASELVGMEKPKEDLIKLLQEHAMVCIHGFAGMGKTTLADLVYHEIGPEVQCRAFVSLSKGPDMVVVLGAILSQVTNGVQSADRISHFLTDKRYLVIVDDIWHWQDWKIIRAALPKGSPMGRIITTTRLNAIAEKCVTEEGAFIYRHSGVGDQDAAALARALLLGKSDNMRRVTTKLVKDGLDLVIADMCCGMPLALHCFSSATKWVVLLKDGMTWARHEAPYQLMRRSHFKPLVESLRLYYDDLPVHLKTCLLYCSIYPSRYKIERHGLVTKWMAEGFVCNVEAAEACLDELVSMHILQRAEGKKNYYSIHPMMRAFLVCKSQEANFVAVDDQDWSFSYTAGRIRRLSVVGFCPIRPSGDNTSTMDASCTRSLVVFSYPWPHTSWILIPWEQLQHLRVLSIEDDSGVPLCDTDLVDICSRMLLLRYLGLKGTPINVLPSQIGRLQNLETLDVSHTVVSDLTQKIKECFHLKYLNLSNTCVGELPREIGKLQHLDILDISKTMVRELPSEIGDLLHLKTLDLSNTEVRELPREIRKLQHLKTLNISNTKVGELPASLFSISVFSSSVSDTDLAVLRSWKKDTTSSSLAEPRQDLSIKLCDDFCQFLPVAGLKVVSRHLRVPKWVTDHLANVSSLDIRICKLEDEDLKFLREMPNLKVLTLRFEVPPKEPIVITAGGFSSIESFSIDCHRLPPVAFSNKDPHKPVADQNKGGTFKKEPMPTYEQLEASEQEVMPNLKHLEFKFYGGRELGKGPVGITHLHSLTTVTFRSSSWYKSDAPGISAVINKVRKEVKEHRNRITIFFNGKDELVTQEKKTTTASADTSRREGNITDNGPSSSGAISLIHQTRLPSNDIDDEKGNIVPVSSYYPFGVTE